MTEAQRTLAPEKKRVSLGFDLKADSEGAFRARICKYGVTDHDGDVTLRGAFPVGKELVISAYMHGSWTGALPVGKGVVSDDEQFAYVDGQFLIDTTDGLDTYKVVKALGKLMEWSYGFHVLEKSTDPADLTGYGGAWRLLKKVEPFEASPVLLGAGIETGTEFVKSLGMQLRDHEALARALDAEVVARWKALAASIRTEGKALSDERRQRAAADEVAMRKSGQDRIALADELKAVLGEITPEPPKAALAGLVDVLIDHTRRDAALAASGIWI